MSTASAFSRTARCRASAWAMGVGDHLPANRARPGLRFNARADAPTPQRTAYPIGRGDEGMPRPPASGSPRPRPSLVSGRRGLLSPLGPVCVRSRLRVAAAGVLRADGAPGVCAGAVWFGAQGVDAPRRCRPQGVRIRGGRRADSAGKGALEVANPHARQRLGRNPGSGLRVRHVVHPPLTRFLTTTFLRKHHDSPSRNHSL